MTSREPMSEADMQGEDSSKRVPKPTLNDIKESYEQVQEDLENLMDIEVDQLNSQDELHNLSKSVKSKTKDFLKFSSRLRDRLATLGSQNEWRETTQNEKCLRQQANSYVVLINERLKTLGLDQVSNMTKVSEWLQSQQSTTSASQRSSPTPSVQGGEQPSVHEETQLPPAGTQLPPAGTQLPPAGTQLPPAGIQLPPVGITLADALQGATSLQNIAPMLQYQPIVSSQSPFLNNVQSGPIIQPNSTKGTFFGNHQYNISPIQNVQLPISASSTQHLVTTTSFPQFGSTSSTFAATMRPSIQPLYPTASAGPCAPTVLPAPPTAFHAPSPVHHDSPSTLDVHCKPSYWDIWNLRLCNTLDDDINASITLEEGYIPINL